MSKALALLGVLIAFSCLVGCESFPEAKDATVEVITFRDGWHVYRIIDKGTDNVVYVSPTSYYGVTVAPNRAKARVRVEEE